MKVDFTFGFLKLFFHFFESPFILGRSRFHNFFRSSSFMKSLIQNLLHQSFVLINDTFIAASYLLLSICILLSICNINK